MVKRINLNEDSPDILPDKAAVYAIFSETGFHYVGETENLMESIKIHLDPDKADTEFKRALHSGREKLMIYELMPKSGKNTRKSLQKEWIEKYKPSCNFRIDV